MTETALVKAVKNGWANLKRKGEKPIVSWHLTHTSREHTPYRPDEEKVD